VCRQVERILGPPKFDDDIATRTGIPGVAMGMAFTMFGGDVLFIEASKHAGNGAIHITGNLGDVSANCSWRACDTYLPPPTHLVGAAEASSTRGG
jgi:ATP-dependent Lon protease